MNKIECARMLYETLPDGNKIYIEHMQAYGEVLLHVLAGDLINEPLIELLRRNKNKELIQLYCKLIERMWQEGDAEVVNVVDVTVLERLSDELDVWKYFGDYVSEEFKMYVNEDVIPNNLMMPPYELE